MFFFSSFMVYSQELLELKKQLTSKALHDTTKVLLYHKIADLLQIESNDSALFYNKKALDLSLRLASNKYIAYSQYSLGVYYHNSFNYTEAINQYLKAEVYYKKSDNKLYLAKLYRNMGACLIEIYKEDKGLEYYLKSLALYKEINNNLGIASIYMLISDLYYNEKNYEFTIKYLNQALVIYQEEANVAGIANCYTNLGNAKADSGLLNEGLELYKQSIEIQKEFDDQHGIAINFNNIGDCYKQLKDYKNARKYLVKALKKSKDIEDNNLIAVILLNLSAVDNKLKNYNSAITYSLKSLEISQELGSLEYQLENLQNLALAFEKKGNIPKAFSFYKKLEKVKDTISANNKTQKVHLFEALNKLESSQYEIKELANKNKIAQLKNETDRKFMSFLAISMVLFGVFVVLLISQKTEKRKAYALLEYKNHQINKMNTEIKIQRDDLERSNKTKDTFFSIIAHDLRSPFNSIKGFSELMIENNDVYDKDKRLRFLKIIKGSASRASSLLNNLLIWANSQSGNLDFNPQKYDISLIISDVISLLEIQAINKEIEIKNTVITPIFVYIDKNMIESVFRNLISNAIKFTQSKGVVHISSEIDTNHIKLIIKDTGIGISKEDLINLFSIDVKNSTIGTANELGSGLGLILCKNFVERNGGELQVKSTLNKGSEFSFTLPLSKE